MRAVDVIRKKRDGKELSAAEIDSFVAGATRGAWADYQCSALLMAILLRGMNAAETAALTAAMVRTGARLDWSELPGVAVDKHSTGGVGDKTSLILAPLAAACGVLVPMMSGRGLGHTGGTLDKLEAIPGFRTALSLAEMRGALARVGGVMLSPTPAIAPADAKLYALRDVTATVESIPLISASIMSKKLAEGVRGLVLDVKFGSGAFMTRLDDARELARSMKAIGEAEGVPTRALLTRMHHPLGRTAGNALEVRECLDVLKGGGPEDIRDLSLHLAAHMVHIAGAAPDLAEAEARVRDALASGRGLEKMRAMIEAQGGDPHVVDDPGRLPTAAHREMIRAHRTGHVRGWDALCVGRAVWALGAGRARAGEAVDLAVGVVVHVRPGHRVREGDALIEVHHHNDGRLAAALTELEGACPIDDEAPEVGPLVHEVMH